MERQGNQDNFELEDLEQNSLKEESSRLIGEIKPARRTLSFTRLIKYLFIFVLMVGVIFASFWVSFGLGKKILISRSKPEIALSTEESREPEKIVAKAENEKVEVKSATTTVLKPKPKPKPAVVSERGKFYKVQAGVFSVKSGALNLSKRLKESGFDTYIKKISTGWRVQVGAFKTISRARSLQSSLSAKGFDSVLVYE